MSLLGAIVLGALSGLTFGANVLVAAAGYRVGRHIGLCLWPEDLTCIKPEVWDAIDNDQNEVLDSCQFQKTAP